MRPHVLSATIFLLCVSALSPGMSAIDATDTKLLTQPAISANHIAFIYAGICSSRIARTGTAPPMSPT
jgi:hypothetical protein